MMGHKSTQPDEAFSIAVCWLKRYIPRSSERRTFAYAKKFEETFMKRTALALLFFLCAPLALLAQSAPEIPFDSVPNFIKLPPNMYLGEVPGVAVNSKGHVFVF